MDFEKLALSLLSTVIWFVASLVLFGFSVWLMERLSPFSIRKEIEEDHNVSLGIVIGSALIGIAIVLSAVIRS